MTVTAAEHSRQQLEEEASHQLAQRLRIGFWFIVIACAIYAIADFFLNREGLRQILALRLLVFLILFAGIGALRLRSTRRWSTVVGLLVGTGICWDTAIMGVAVGDDVTTTLVALIFATISGSLLPWSLTAHGVLALAATAAAIFNILMVHGGTLPSAYAYPTGAVTFVLIGSSYLSFEMARNRAALWQQKLDRERAEADLRRSEERFALATRGANDGLWDWSLEANETYFSPRWKQMLGYDEDEIGPRIDEWRQRIHPEDQRNFASEMSKHMRGLTEHFECEHRLRHKDGSYRWMLARGQSIRDASGKPYRIAGSLTDLTERKRAEEAERAHQAELAHVARLGTMGTMAAGMAHELNQPLGAIVSYARGCARRIQTGSIQQPELLDALEKIAAQAVRAAEIIRRLRNFARKGEPKRERIEVNELVREAARFAETEAHQYGLHLQFDLAGELPPIEVDAVQIEQVILNLLRNGFEAIQDSDTEYRDVLISTELDGRDRVVISISDWGKGIMPGIADRIFDPFFTTKATGLGMGLSISRSIIESHGGHLWATPNADRGTTFQFTLPVATGGRLNAA